MINIIEKYGINNTTFEKNEVLGYDVTDKKNPKPIIFSDDNDGFIFIQCKSYNYLLTWREFLMGVSQGWVQI